MKIFKIEGEYIVKEDFLNLLQQLIKEIKGDDIVELNADYESNIGGKLTAKIENVELEDLREKS